MLVIVVVVVLVVDVNDTCSYKNIINNKIINLKNSRINVTIFRFKEYFKMYGSNFNIIYESIVIIFGLSLFKMDKN